MGKPCSLINEGVRPGDSLSFDLFNAVFEERMRNNIYGIRINGKHLTNVKFADHIIVLSKTTEELTEQVWHYWALKNYWLLFGFWIVEIYAWNQHGSKIYHSTFGHAFHEFFFKSKSTWTVWWTLLCEIVSVSDIRFSPLQLSWTWSIFYILLVALIFNAKVTSLQTYLCKSVYLLTLSHLKKKLLIVDIKFNAMSSISRAVLTHF